MCESVESRRNWVFFPKRERSSSVFVHFAFHFALIPMLGNVMLVPFTFSEGRNAPKDCSNSSLRLAHTEECSEYV